MPIKGCQVDFEISEYEDRLFVAWGIDCPPKIRRAVVKRKAEFLAGRIAAGFVLSKLNLENHNITIGKNREPVWPLGINGSITHTNSKAAAIIAPDKDITFLGLDREDWIDSRVSREIVSSILDSYEIHQLESANTNLAHFDYNQRLTILYSAKETFFKALHPKIKSYFDFKDARVNLGVEQTDSLEISLSRALSRDYLEGFMLPVKFKTDTESATTYIIE
nr:4'-phosphopantetheinyl transferase superfamily protein [Aliikangiella sp. G2MR2-5]